MSQATAAAATPTADIVFSDIDGTLVHYPKQFCDYASVVSSDASAGTVVVRYTATGEERECATLTSTTGGDSYISLRTLSLISSLRALGARFVLITGARASTYADRRPVLPPSDLEYYENGGRKLSAGALDAAWSDTFVAEVGEITDRTSIAPPLPPPHARAGVLWRLHDQLHDAGWRVDARDYATNFRVDVVRSVGHDVDEFRALLEAELPSRGLASSFNLGKADIYPAASGKANAARDAMRQLGVEPSDTIALFDDDNDIELGALCGAGFLPGVTHRSVLEALEKFPKWTLMPRKGFLGTEDALEQVIALRKAALAEGRAKFPERQLAVAG